MSDDAPAAAGGAAAPVAAEHHDAPGHHHQEGAAHNRSRKSTWTKSVNEIHVSGTQTPMSGLNRVETGLDSYFVGPRDMDAHSKLPYFLRVHGSVTPRMILPLTLIGAWATCVTCISEFIYPLGVNTLLLTVLGFVVGLALSFRSTTAYERYSDGRKSWATLSVQSRNLARLIWVHVSDQAPGSDPNDTSTLLSKISALNLILAFAVSLKHKLRFEPYAHYPDLSSLISHLDTFAKSAHDDSNLEVPKKTPWKAVGEYLGLSFASSNPRKIIKRSTAPLGNLPLEILTYLSAYVEEVSTNLTLKSPVVYGQLLTAIAALTDTQSSAERVLTTPLPVGYNILISQIVLLYVYLLPFQLYGALKWITIPGTIAAAYIILGIAAIGNELENPFGNDVNDLPLDQYCEELRRELDTLMSVPAPVFSKSVKGENRVLWPLSDHGFDMWNSRSENDIRGALKTKVFAAKPASISGSTVGSVKFEA